MLADERPAHAEVIDAHRGGFCLGFELAHQRDVELAQDRVSGENDGAVGEECEKISTRRRPADGREI